MATGRCQCGAVHYEVQGEPVYSALCHCSDCRKSAGAPMVGWALFTDGQVTVRGETVRYQSSDNVLREFCGTCGTGLFYRNSVAFPGMVDIQTATLDDQSVFPPGIHVQYAEAAPWMGGAHDLPKFDRYPATPADRGMPGMGATPGTPATPATPPSGADPNAGQPGGAVPPDTGMNPAPAGTPRDPAAPMGSSSNPVTVGGNMTPPPTGITGAKDYPVCSRAVQDSCINPDEARKSMRRRR